MQNKRTLLNELFNQVSSNLYRINYIYNSIIKEVQMLELFDSIYAI